MARRSRGRGTTAPASGSAGKDCWALWTLRALKPDATVASLAALRARRRELADLEQRILVEGRGDTDRLFADARAVLDAHPHLRTGVIATLHMGPYTLVPALLVAVGDRPAVLLDAAAHEAVRPRAEAQRRRLGLPGDVEWIVVERTGFVRDVLRALRDRRPVVVYLDGNRGAGGPAATRDHGLAYRLPGRVLRLRTGLARLITRTGVPVHGVAPRWRDDGLIDWSVTPLGPWPVETSVEEVTRGLYDWMFRQVDATPEQWSYWGMLAASSDCFATRNLAVSGPRDHARRNAVFLDRLVRRPGSARLALTSRVEVWEPDVLVDLDRDAFYGAEGLRETALDMLRGTAPTLAELIDWCGRDWVGFHGRRLYLLGLAELRADP